MNCGDGTTTIGPTTITSTTGKGFCSAEEIYGEDPEEIELLRYIRDNVLSQTSQGQEVIRLYYEQSPMIVGMMKKDEGFKREIEEMIDWVLIMTAAKADQLVYSKSHSPLIIF